MKPAMSPSVNPVVHPSMNSAVHPAVCESSVNATVKPSVIPAVHHSANPAVSPCSQSLGQCCYESWSEGGEERQRNTEKEREGK